MRVNDDFEAVNIEAQMKSQAGENGISVMRFWQELLKERKSQKDTFVYGNFEVAGATRETMDKIFAYARTNEDGHGALIVLNFSGEEVEWDIPDIYEVDAWVIGNYEREDIPKATQGRIMMRPWEGVFGRCVKSEGMNQDNVAVHNGA